MFSDQSCPVLTPYRSILKSNQIKQCNVMLTPHKSLGFLKRNLTVSNTDIKSRAYQTLVRPKLEYSCSVWDPHNNEYKKKIEMVQRQRAALWTITTTLGKCQYNDRHSRLANTSWVSPQNTTHYVLQNYTLPHCHSIKHLSAIRQQVKKTSFTILSQHIQTSKDTYKWSFSPHIIIQWNILTQHTVQSTTIDIFREQLTPTVLYPLM